MAWSDQEDADPRLAALAASLVRLDEGLSRPPRVVLLGEGNVGKSSVANLLLGRSLLPTSIIENTQTPTLLRYAEALEVVVVTKQGRRKLDASQLETVAGGNYESLEIGVPADRLKSFEILDTPADMGVRWLAREPASPDARLVAWCTTATQAWKESERRTWVELPSRLKRNAVLVVTNKDRLKSDQELQSLDERLRAVTRGQFRHIAFISARQPSLTGRLDPAAWRAESGVADLEGCLLSRLIAMKTHRLRAAARILQRLHRLE
jgi:GTPase SAR1 family protein